MEFQTLKQSHLKRNILIGVVAVLIISAVVLNFTRAKYRVTQSIPLVNGTINYSLADLNIVALYIDGVAADELDSSKNYTLDTDQSTCTYKDGSTIQNLTLSYDADTKTFTITPYTTKGTKCTLYFEESKGTPAVDVIEEAYIANSNMLAYDDYGNLRYIGANPNNYVLFNNELWRIIGVFSEDSHGVSGEKLVKIIRSESLGRMSWDSADINDWSTASLQTILNGDYLNGTGSYASSGITSDIARNMIETVTWKLGGSSTYNDVTPSMFYERERGTTVYSGRPTTWSGKVALMYPSDYGYATSGGSTTNRDACLAKELFNWNSSSFSDCKNNDWLYDSSTIQWTLTPNSSNSDCIVFVNNTGYVDNSTLAYNSIGVRPSVYLTSSVSIIDGNGSSSNPYQLELS